MTWIKSLLRGAGRLDRPGDSRQQFVQREFDGLSDRGKGVFEFLDFTNCTFRSCALSLSQDWLKNRSMVRHVNLTRCTAAATQVGAAIFEDVVVDGLSTRGLLRCHGSAYRRVVLKGKIGPIMITEKSARSKGKRNLTG